jgi:hypothetical protein
MKNMMIVLFAVLAVMVILLGSTAFAGERVIQVRTAEDARVIVGDDICAEAPFTSNVRLGAYAWSFQTRASDGSVVNDMINDVGTAKACVRITDFRFTPLSIAHFYIVFNFRQEAYAGLGVCTVTSNNVPEPGLVLAGCSLSLKDRASGADVGIAVSSSVFNPFHLPGYETGSYWTLKIYE